MVTKEQIVTYLVTKYGAKGIVLYGSRADGLAKELSDWDLFVFTDKPESEIQDYCEYHEFNGQQLEVSTYAIDCAKDANFILKTSSHPIDKAVVLYDDLDGMVAETVARSTIYYSESRPPHNHRQHDLRLKILRKFLWKVKARPDQNEIVFFGTSQFFIYAVRYWFESRGRWPLPIHKALSVIKEEDQPFAQLLETLCFEGNTQSRVDAMHGLYSKIEAIRFEY